MKNDDTESLENTAPNMQHLLETDETVSINSATYKLSTLHLIFAVVVDAASQQR